jgi:hypothetical protein
VPDYQDGKEAIMKIFGPNIERMKSKRNINGLVAALGVKQEARREAALEALLSLGHPAVLDPLVEALNHPTSQISTMAESGLAKIGLTAVDKLSEIAIKHPDKGKRACAARVLTDIQDQITNPETLCFLVNLWLDGLKDSSGSVRTSATYGLDRIFRYHPAMCNTSVEQAQIFTVSLKIYELINDPVDQARINARIAMQWAMPALLKIMPHKEIYEKFIPFDNEIEMKVVKVIYQMTGDSKLKKRISEEAQRICETKMSDWFNKFIFNWGYPPIPARVWIDMIECGAQAAALLISKYQRTLNSPVVSSDAPGMVKEREAIVGMLNSLCQSEAGLDHLFDFLERTSQKKHWENEVGIIARVLNPQSQEFFEKLSETDRNLLVESLGKLIKKSTEERWHHYAQEVLKKLGDSHSVQMLSKLRRERNLKTHQHYLRDFSPGGRWGRCNVCNTEMALEYSAVRYERLRIDHWSYADTLSYYCPDCFDDATKDHDPNRGRLLISGSVAKDTIVRDTSDNSIIKEVRNA